MNNIDLMNYWIASSDKDYDVMKDSDIDIAIITDDIKCHDVFDEQLNLKQLGFKSSLYGTKLLIKVILKASALDDYYTLNDIYSVISQETDLSVNDISVLVFNSLNSRKKDISKKNFENIFGYEYNENDRILKISLVMNIMKMILNARNLLKI